MKQEMAQTSAAIEPATVGNGLESLKDIIDFKKLADRTGIESLKIVEMQKVMNAQMEYQQRLNDMIFEILGEVYIRWFGRDKFEKLYKKYFPKGRKYYIDIIAKSDSLLSELQNEVLKHISTQKVSDGSPPPIPSDTKHVEMKQ